jgi:polysaccharide transporter, PST family
LKPFDAHGRFYPSVLDGEVRRLAIRGAGVTVFSGGVALAIQVVATIILARLLTPMDFGVVTMVTTLSLLFVNFGLNGFTEAVLQWEEMNHSLASNLFWINTGFGIVLTIGFAAAGSLMARFYRDPRVTDVAIGVSTSIIFTSISVVHIALLKRAMRFTVTSANEILSRAIAVVMSIALAWKGWGYWALVAGAIVQPLAQTVGAWFLCPWLPGFPRRAPGTASMVRFAMNVYGRFTVNYFSRNTDNLLVGWRFGSISLGFYKKAYDLFALSANQLTAPITNVAVSALSRFNPRSAQYRQNLLSALSVIAFVGMALSGDCTLIGKDLVRVLLGPGWESAGQIFTFFAPGIGAMVIYCAHGWIHLSIGRADRWLRWGIIEVVVTCLLFLLALPWGPVGVAVAWSTAAWALLIPAFWYAGKPVDFRIVSFFAAIWRYLAASLMAGFATVAFGRVLPLVLAAPRSTQQAASGLAVITLLFVPLYLGAVVLLHGGLAPLHRLERLVREMILPSKLAEPIPASLATAEPDWRREPLSKDAGKPLVSILVPAFNSEEWIAGTIRSALAQTWERKEVIVVDDGSTDETLVIARQFESRGVRVLTQNRQGAAAARNKAFSVSQGDYIQWLDADDLLAPDKIAKQMEAVEKCQNKRLVLSSRFGRFLYRPYRATFVPTALWCDLSPADWLVRKMGQNIYMQTGTWLVSRELTEAAGPWDTNLLADDDGEYFCRVLLQSEGVRFVPDATLYYRAPWVGTLSHIAGSKAKLKAHWRSMQLHIRYLRSLEDSARARAACLTYLQTLFPYFYPEMSDVVGEMERTAVELGSHLDRPRLPWKYAWVEKLFGWGPAKSVEMIVPQIKWWFCKSWEKFLFRFERRFLPAAAMNQGGTMDVAARPAKAED